MMKFILKGIFRDRHRWLFPLLIVSVGVIILVFTLSFMEGYKNSFIRQNARFDSGHVKVVSRAYAEMLQQKPYDLAMLDIQDDLKLWKAEYPQLDWVERIGFAALLDIPDNEGNTRAQGEVLGFALDILDNKEEVGRLHLDSALCSGRLPQHTGEVLLSDSSFKRLNLALGDDITLIGATVFGAMSMQNFIVVGSVNFGVQSLDRGAVIGDIADIRKFLDMEQGASEILAYFKSGNFDSRQATDLARKFNIKFSNEDDEFSPQMLTMMQQNNLGYLIGIFSQTMYWMGVGFIFILGIVLWNSGLMNGIRRYGEFGVRLAIGESKSRVYKSLLAEAFVIGLIGSCIGLLIGFAITLYFNKHGMDVSTYNRNTTILSENMIYTDLTLTAVLASFIPGVFSTLFGSALAGIAVFNRQTSQLFKELET